MLHRPLEPAALIGHLGYRTSARGYEAVRIALNAATTSHAADRMSSVQKMTMRTGMTRYVSWTWMSTPKESGNTNLTANASMTTNPAPIRCFIGLLRAPCTSGVCVCPVRFRQVLVNAVIAEVDVGAGNFTDSPTNQELADLLSCSVEESTSFHAVNRKE